VYSGKRPLEDLKHLWACRSSVTLPAAHQALSSALKEKAARDASETKKDIPR
jgi:hypothetical protein